MTEKVAAREDLGSISNKTALIKTNGDKDDKENSDSEQYKRLELNLIAQRIPNLLALTLNTLGKKLLENETTVNYFWLWVLVTFL